MAVKIIEPPYKKTYAGTVLNANDRTLSEMSITLTAGRVNPQIEVVVPSGGDDVAVQVSGAAAVFTTAAKIPAGSSRKFVESSTERFSAYNFISESNNVIIGIYEMGYTPNT